MYCLIVIVYTTDTLFEHKVANKVADMSLAEFGRKELDLAEGKHHRTTLFAAHPSLCFSL